MTIDECARIEELISAMQDNAATPEEAARVERHIAGCARCRATTAAYQRVDQQVRRYIMATPVPEIAAPWRNEPLIVPVRRGGGGLGHWRITLVGLATIFVLLLAGSLLTFRSLGLNPSGPTGRESGPTAVAQSVADGPSSAPAAAPAAAIPTAAAAFVPPAPAGGGAAPAASAAPATSSGGATAPTASSVPRTASGAAPAASAGAAASAAPAAAPAASAAPAPAPAASAAASAAPALAATPPPPAATRAPSASPPGPGSASSTPTFDNATFNPAQAYRLAGATSLTICRPECDAQPQTAEVLQRVVAALNQPLVREFVPPSTVRIPYVTLRFRLADGQQIDIGYYLQVNILQMPDGKGTFAAPPDLIAALAGSVAPR